MGYLESLLVIRIDFYLLIPHLSPEKVKLLVKFQLRCVINHTTENSTQWT